MSELLLNLSLEETEAEQIPEGWVDRKGASIFARGDGVNAEGAAFGGH